jgi:hypothetical protein
VARACTVVELQNDGFATNALYLMHAIPIFHGQNGTLYLDNTDLPYACSPDGGFHDFFKYEEYLVPWCDEASMNPPTCHILYGMLPGSLVLSSSCGLGSRGLSSPDP